MAHKKGSAKFDDESLSEALDRAISNAGHLRAKDAAAVKAARDLARKIDAWDVIVDWALEDARETRGRPRVPQNDNVSLETFRKYLDVLGLTPEREAPKKGEAKTKAPEKTTQLDAWQKKRGQ